MRYCTTCGVSSADIPFVKRKNKCVSCYNKYMAEYMTKRYHTRRNSFIVRHHSTCAVCGDTEGPFEIDHIEKNNKEFNIAIKLSSASMATIEKELAKCQLLCVSCHLEKTVEEKKGHPSWNKGKTKIEGAWRDSSAYAVHGTPKMYSEFACRCSMCKKAKKDYRNKLVDYNGRPKHT